MEDRALFFSLIVLIMLEKSGGGGGGGFKWASQALHMYIFLWEIIFLMTSSPFY